MIRILLLFVITLIACTSKDRMTYFQGLAMTMPYRITIAKQLSKSEKEKVSEAIYEVFKEVDTIYNNWNPDSEISKFNKNSSTDWIKLSDQLSTLLHQCNAFVEMTDALFDPTVGTIIPKWKEALQQHQSLQCINDCMGWKYLQIKKNAIQKPDSICQLDLCAVSKGYAVDLLSTKLIEMGYYDFFVEWGGEVKCFGKHISKRDWRLQIITADKEPIPGKYQHIHLHNQAIATSGKFMMYEWKVGNEKYTHIFNPKTKSPVKDNCYSLSSVSVIAPHCALADALATACMTFENINDATAWAKNIVEKNSEITFYLFNPKQMIFIDIPSKTPSYFDGPPSRKTKL